MLEELPKMVGSCGGGGDFSPGVLRFSCSFFLFFSFFPRGFPMFFFFF